MCSRTASLSAVIADSFFWSDGFIAGSRRSQFTLLTYKIFKHFGRKIPRSGSVQRLESLDENGAPFSVECIQLFCEFQA
jgi:hypothetical protein